MKIAIVNDQHFGIKNNSTSYLDYQKYFFDNVFFPYLDKHNIKVIFDLGDTFDNRKTINYEMLYKVKEFYFNEISKRNIDLHILMGNHSVYYRNSNNINSPDLVLNEYSNIKTYSTPQDLVLDDKSYAFIPWINPENYEECKDFAENKSKSSIAFGHLELQGYEVLRGIKCDEGYSSKLLSKFSKVYSGHFHMKSGDGHINYLGTQYDMTFSDVDETKGFHVFDTETEEIEFIQNPFKLYFKIVYDDNNFESSLKEMKFDKYKNCYVKLIVKTKKNNKLYDSFVKKLYDSGPTEVAIVEEYLLSQAYETSEELNVSEDTLTAISKHIDDLGEEIKNPDRIKKIMHDLYIESFEVDS